MTHDEIVRALKEMLPPQVDYAELVCSPVPSSYGVCYVWENPEPYHISAAIDLIESLQAQLAESQRRERAALEDLSTYKDCGFCAHLQDQQYCYKNCQRHVDVDNFRTHPCWQWHSPQEAGEGERK